ncbi:sensor histidine kinase [Actinomadura madurae]|uniref:sensor histidine kinase n=1 Tax=Actinomadura madurae TaxID=1993 RepID=UPI0020263F06|nr:sensor histidine kinase [Actinomadura madurae]MCP9953679.1 sensor histidine kinase [Actinomadura madurae]MCP9970435.1 sensor histidine kinase [Actinomadura madurae]MCP9982916.1 sensor histidine kinase [Actinomadura madurae]MCQ0005535.1 sensor histidine kinase [Actinomadura madurae]MCQ0019149.1 sensor histidine kinase [Actinomadura madurae]
MALEHRAFLYGGTDEFLSVAVPYLKAGLERDQAVVAVAREPNLAALRDTLAPYGAAIDYIDSAGFYQHPVRTLRDYQNLVRDSAPRSVCALAEPVWDGWSERQALEWVRYESLINVVFGETDACALCPYDTETLPARILNEARRTHPLLVTGRQDGGNSEYVDPVAFGAGCDRRVRLDRPADADYLAIDGADLHGLRSFVGERAHKHGLAKQTAQNLVTAANEVAANALQHGTPPIGLWVWQDGPDLICEVGDHGFWHPAPGPLTGYVPPDSALQRGFGLWTVRLLVDLMELRTGWDGTFVRLLVHP